LEQNKRSGKYYQGTAGINLIINTGSELLKQIVFNVEYYHDDENNTKKEFIDFKELLLGDNQQSIYSVDYFKNSKDYIFSKVDFKRIIINDLNLSSHIVLNTDDKSMILGFQLNYTLLENTDLSLIINRFVGSEDSEFGSYYQKNNIIIGISHYY
ncbi:MAG: hypothetical protein L3J12_01545, partial [Spirochaetales bacterium]|nr:hypothetical protein [Spirochaetales bacterium]